MLQSGQWPGYLCIKLAAENESRDYRKPWGRAVDQGTLLPWLCSVYDTVDEHRGEERTGLKMKNSPYSLTLIRQDQL